ncbi:hypothetical protein [Agromyces archimandritae]|uniref:Uncharacterized protein n=1 Tax=Agromyces archimandritae TaxID=2781962 RepID=A0A975FLM0_9MICO|nr:hypothetical protein [Agromyces archimandritae]QTX04151.1 hypothetical protein G127AT_12745 [Agromyces archimandritae]
MRAARPVIAGVGLAALLVGIAGPAQAAGPAAGAVRAETVGDCPIDPWWGRLFGMEECEEAPEPDPGETPAPTETPAPGETAAPADPADPSKPADPAAPATPPPAPTDTSGQAFTTEPAQMSGGSIWIEGLSGISIVTVPLIDGTTERALRIEADKVVVGDFTLDVPSGDGGLRNTATTLTVEGNVVIYSPSITGILENGAKRVIDTLSEPTPESLAGLLTISLPLLGMTSDTIRYDDSHQATFE